MRRMRYCRECVLPDTRPGLVIGPDGVCNACKNSREKCVRIDWAKRSRMFREVVRNAKSRSRGYDCLVPVSGGKDSTWQVLKCLEHGLNTLAVTWKTPARTKIGAGNLANLIRLGVDHIDYQINPNVEKKFMYKSFVRYGTTAIPMHMAIFNIPLKVAAKFNIPLIVYGENSAMEYGSPKEELKGFSLNSEWLKRFGVMHGTAAKDWVSKDLSKRELTAYFGPSESELAQKDIRAIFLGYYFKWDPKAVYETAKRYGFRARPEGAKTGLYDYADIDCDFVSVHHYFKWLKFGFTRLFDNLSLEIRNGRLSRQEAVAIIQKTGDQTPREDIKKLCRFLGITEARFHEIEEKFRNRDIWKKGGGKWKIENFLVKNWEWK